ncbi:MAG: amidohydrolase family protein [Colwellia sp.]
MKIIDPHLHLFNLKQGDYHWLKPENEPFWPDKSRINTTFTESDLSLESPLQLAGFVHIEAGFDNQYPWRELTSLVHSCNKPFKAIASIDLTSPSQKFNSDINKLSTYHSFVGVRHILDNQALSLLTTPQVLNNFTALNKKGLIFELQLNLIEDAPIDALCEIIANNPTISFIINHAGFPPCNIQSREWQQWQNNLLKLSMYPHVAIKCSGWEMTDRHYSQAWLSDNLAFILTIFGLKKMMLASNFPLCLFNQHNYQNYWLNLLSTDFFQTKTMQEKSALLHDNALLWYQFNA